MLINMIQHRTTLTIEISNRSFSIFFSLPPLYSIRKNKASIYHPRPPINLSIIHSEIQITIFFQYFSFVKHYYRRIVYNCE